MNQERAEIAAQFMRDLLEENTRRTWNGHERGPTYDSQTSRPRDDLRADIDELIRAGLATFKDKT